jgi:hypothetical protein
LAVADVLVITFSPLVFNDIDFGAFNIAEDQAGDRRIGNQGRADFGIAFAADEQNVVEGDVLLLGQRTQGPVDANDIAAGDLKLFTALRNNRVHEQTPKQNPNRKIFDFRDWRGNVKDSGGTRNRKMNRRGGEDAEKNAEKGIQNLRFNSLI